MITIAEATQIYRYAAAGVLNTIVAYAVFATLLSAETHYAVATLVGGFAGMLVSYSLNSKWVFAYSGKQRYKRFVIVFVLLYIGNVSIQKGVMLWIVHNGYVAGAIGVAVTAGVGYLLGRSWVFAEPASVRSTARSSLYRNTSPPQRNGKGKYWSETK